jgi:hypothetical protein
LKRRSNEAEKQRSNEVTMKTEGVDSRRFKVERKSGEGYCG